MATAGDNKPKPVRRSSSVAAFRREDQESSSISHAGAARGSMDLPVGDFGNVEVQSVEEAVRSASNEIERPPSTSAVVKSDAQIRRRLMANTLAHRGQQRSCNARGSRWRVENFSTVRTIYIPYTIQIHQSKTSLVHRGTPPVNLLHENPPKESRFRDVQTETRYCYLLHTTI